MGLTVRHGKTKIIVDKIQKAALQVFSANGFEGSSIRQIAKAAGLNHQKLTYYFSTKENLFISVLEKAFQELGKMSDALVFNPEEQDPIIQFTQHLKQVAWYFSQNPEFIVIIYQETLSNSPRLETIKPLIQSYKNNMMRELVYLREYGFGVNCTVEQLMLMFSGAFHARFIHPYVNPVIAGKSHQDKQEIEAYIDVLCSTFTKD